jgi:hypothetical protein
MAHPQKLKFYNNHIDVYQISLTDIMHEDIKVKPTLTCATLWVSLKFHDWNTQVLDIMYIRKGCDSAVMQNCKICVMVVVRKLHMYS